MRELLRKALCIHLSFALTLMGTGCAGQRARDDDEPEQVTVQEAGSGLAGESMSVIDLPEVQVDGYQYAGLSDPEYQRYLEDAIYSEIVTNLDSEQFVVENVEVVYISQEYLDELAYNSQANIFFGYTLDELETIFQGEKYVFALDDDGNTIVRAFEGYDDSFSSDLRNFAIGGGVILACVTVSIAAGAAASAGIPGMSAVCMLFKFAAEKGAIRGLESMALGGLSSGILAGLETGDMEQALRGFINGASEGFKWGAIVGAFEGGATEAAGLFRTRRAIANTYGGTRAAGLTVDQIAAIQRRGYPLDVIEQIGSWEQFEILNNTGVVPRMVNGRTALVRDIDLDFIGEDGMTNMERMMGGRAPLDPATGLPYELHHVGQRPDSTLAILTQAEHRLGENYSTLHPFGSSDVHVNPSEWSKQKRAFWKAFVDQLMQ